MRRGILHPTQVLQIADVLLLVNGLLGNRQFVFINRCMK
jgi:hypothetical protein